MGQDGVKRCAVPHHATRSHMRRVREGSPCHRCRSGGSPPGIFFANIRPKEKKEKFFLQELVKKVFASLVIFDLDNARSRSWPRSNVMVTFEAYSSIDMFAFLFMAIGQFLAEIYQIPNLTLKIKGESHKESWPKSNQVIYISGLSILQNKWKKSKKLFRSYCENKSLWWLMAAAAAAETAYKPVQKHKVTPSIPEWLN